MPWIPRQQPLWRMRLKHSKVTTRSARLCSRALEEHSVLELTCAKWLMGAERRLMKSGAGPMGPTWLQLSKPVIAAIEGHAVAGGLELALWCDLRVAARDAVFGVFNRRFSVPLIDLGTVRLPRMIGQGRALDLILTGRSVSGEEALQMGLVNRLVEPSKALKTALELAHTLTAFPQHGLRADRKSVYEQWSLSWEDARCNELKLGLQV